jgi:hypothetical protein
MLRSSNPIFIQPPESLFQRRPLIDPGLVAFVGAVAALALLFLLLGLIEVILRFRLGDIVVALLGALKHQGTASSCVIPTPHR